MTRPLALAAAAGSAIALMAGCGSSSTSHTASSSASTSAAATQSTAAAPATTTTAAAGGVTVQTKRGKLGAILAAGPKRLTVYEFEADHGSTSACASACAKAWPPVTTSAAPKASGAAVSADLATLTRSDGTKQVTYKGHPLYFFAKDGDSGDAYGQGLHAFGAGWYVLKPDGSKVDDS